jgi:glycosyltransferase involved in cell wall biosynthesis
LLAGVPAGISDWAERADKKGGFWTALRMRELVQLRQDATRAMLAEVEHIVAVCEWVRDLLIRNGVAPEKLTLSRQGLPYQSTLPHPFESSPNRTVGLPKPIRLAFLGRLDQTKGVEVVIDALAAKPDLELSFDIFGVVQGEGGKQLEARIRGKVECDPRIRLLPPLAQQEIVAHLRGYSALLIPSQWLETGPLVAYEAFAAGIPVVGSDLGGIAELVRDGENGILVRPHASVPAWAETLTRIAKNPMVIENLRVPSKTRRSMDSVACEMRQVYSRVAACARL